MTTGSASNNLNFRALAADLTPEWLTGALSLLYPDVVVEKVDVVRGIPGTCSKIWLDLEYKPSLASKSLPRRMLVKSGFGQHGPIMQFTYKLEMLSYRDVLPNFHINSPHCYYAGPTPDGLSYCVLIEDLCQKSVIFCDPLKPLSYHQAASFLGELARFHAQSWDIPRLKDPTWQWVKESAEAAEGLSSYLDHLLEPEVWLYFMQLPRAAAVPRIFHDRELFLDLLPKISSFNESQPQVIMHGDAHAGNLYIESDGKPGFLDFQCRVGTWSLSVAYLMNTTVDTLDRKAWDKKLLSHYLNCLEMAGVSAPTFDEAWDAYSRQLIFYLFGWLANGAELQPETRCTAVTSRLASAALDSGSLDRIRG